jgi:hypothetical protein
MHFQCDVRISRKPGCVRIRPKSPIQAPPEVPPENPQKSIRLMMGIEVCKVGQHLCQSFEVKPARWLNRISEEV